MNLHHVTLSLKDVKYSRHLGSQTSHVSPDEKRYHMQAYRLIERVDPVLILKLILPLLLFEVRLLPGSKKQIYTTFSYFDMLENSTRDNILKPSIVFSH